jgi:hypothetical protein
MNLRTLFVLTLGFLLLAGGVVAQTPPPPPVPQNLIAMPNPQHPGSAKLQWMAPPGPWVFKVYRSVDDTLGWQSIGITPTPMFVNHNLQPGHVYNYYVTSLVYHNNGIIESPRSNIASFTTQPPPPRVTGTIAGLVMDDTTGLPIRGARVRFFRLPSPTNWAPTAMTDSLGHYQAVLDTGTYLVKAEAMSHGPVAPPYIPEWFDNATDPQSATPVAVLENATFTANFGLSRVPPPTFAFISGTVRDTAGNLLRGASVAIMRTMQEMSAAEGPFPEPPENLEGVGHTHGVVWRGRTDSLGNYRARVIEGRSYIAMASKLGFLPEYYDNKANPMDADIIAVTGDVTGIDFSLAVNVLVQNSISGIVRDSLDTRVPSRIVLFPLRNAPTPMPHGIRFGHTDSLGAYALNNVHLGRYFVLAVPFHGYLPSFYKAGAYGVMRWQDADTVLVSGAVGGIDIGVRPFQGGGIAQVRGRVRNANGGALEGANVVAYTTDGFSGYTITDATGGYVLEGLPVGRTTVLVDHEGYNQSERTVEMSGGYTAQGVDFTLSPAIVLSAGDEPVPSAFSLRQNYPNPFNPSTTIGFTLGAQSDVRLTVYNLIGQEMTTLVNGVMPAGVHNVAWSGFDAAGRALSSGVYLYRLKAVPVNGGELFNEMRKMVLMK